MPLFSPLRLLEALLFGACLALPSSQQAAPEEAGTLVVRRGGTYTGEYRSTDSSVPCVRIETTEPVILKGCRLTGAGNLVEALGGGAQLTIVDCVGEALRPSKDQTRRAHFLEANAARSIRIQNCELRQTTGIKIYQWSGDGTARQTLTVLNNRVRNIDGRYRNGGGIKCNFLGLNQVHGVSNMEVAWNEVVNEPNNSLVEDNINFYNSSGSAASPIRVHDNYVQGAYPYPATGKHFTGSGMTTDGDATTALVATAHILAYDNQFVSTCNAAMNIAAGHDVRYFRNRMVTSGRLPNGAALHATYAATSVFNAYHKPPEVFFGHSIDHNVIGFVKEGYRVPLPNRHDLSTGNCGPCKQNVHLPNPITLRTEQNEWRLWRQKLREQRQVVGPRTAARGGGGNP